MKTPFISVVVIVFNDERRLPRALASLESQTFRDFEVIIVDDASTDTSGRIADEWASAHNARVIHLPENSGGCGAPRNAGLRAASGEYVAFLDSDDTYLPDGLSKMAEQASISGAEVVSLGVQRTNDVTGETKLYNERFYASEGTFIPFKDRSDFFTDSIVPAKLISRQFLEELDLSFPEDLKYEDLLMTAKIWRNAKRAQVHSAVVYDWHYGHESERKSITSSRDDIQNFMDRIEVNRRIDEFLAEEPALLELKVKKFFKHDLGLYLRELVFRPHSYQVATHNSLRDYLNGLPTSCFRHLAPQYKLIRACAIERSLPDLIEASRFVYQKGSSLQGIRITREKVLWSGPQDGASGINVSKFFASLTRAHLASIWHNSAVKVKQHRAKITIAIEVKLVAGAAMTSPPKEITLDLAPRTGNALGIVRRPLKRMIGVQRKVHKYRASFTHSELQNAETWDAWINIADETIRLSAGYEVIRETPMHVTRFGRLSIKPRA